MKRRRNCFRSNRKNQGFTMTEMLVTVAILVILMSVALAGLMTMRRNLRQKELDSKAEIIYVAAQYRLSELKAAGYEDVFAYTANPVGKGNGVRKLGYIPSDALETDEDQDQTEESAGKLCYVVSADKEDSGKAARFMLPKTAVDTDLWGNQWIIEYSPETGTVYAVFYSEGGIDMDGLNMETMDSYRTKNYRLTKGAKIGYYGGDLTLTESTYKLSPSIRIINAEKLIARFYCNNPDSTAALTFTITVKAGDKTYTKEVKPELVGVRTYRYEWVMDSLESKKTGFAAQTGLEAGTNIEVSMTAHSASNLVDDAMAEPVMTNSLFAYQADAPENTAVIRYGRHLQNLDTATSNVTKKITAAVQLQDISFADDPADDEDFYSYYGPYFKPIENSSLRSYNGEKSTYGEGAASGASAIRNLQVQTRQGPSGLFGTFRGETISNLILTGTRLAGGSSVGAVAGSVVGNVTISNCRVYLSSTLGDIDGKEADDPKDVDYRINGTTAGGMVGAVPSGSKLTIQDSFAATTVASRRYAGGLVGSANAAVTIERSYADCYLQSATTGGLVGVASPYATVDLYDVYAVGYQVASKQAAGLVSGNVRYAKRGYAAVDFTTDEDAKVYTTAVKGDSVSQLYYMSGGDLSQGNITMDGSTSISYGDLTTPGKADLANKVDAAKTAFSFGGVSNPYNLMDQALSGYAYPRLTGMDHYGDWQAQFENGTLVYYEYYGNGSYGFYGGNKSTLQNRSVLGDGYALVYTAHQSADSISQVTYADNAQEKPSVQNEIRIDEGENSYYLYPLSTSKINDASLVREGEFYQPILVEDISGNTSRFYYNPNFAATVVTAATLTEAPSVVLIRSPRQLYALSLYYDRYDAAVRKSLFRQELDLNYSTYRWTDYYITGENISVQKPIGSGDPAFGARYDGRYHSISGLSIQAEAKYVGLFGVIGSGSTVQNLVLNGQEKNSNHAVEYRREDEDSGKLVASIQGAGKSVDLGALAGSNNGYIRNCAVYGMKSEIYAYDNATVRVGGFVGSNYGTISACSADTRSLEMASSFAHLYGGGFAGLNRGTVSESYSVGLLNFKDFRESTVVISGFAADNNGGNLIRSYAGVALNFSGEVGAYGFAPTGGYASGCYYLDKGTYAYNDQLYSFNISTGQSAANSVGTALDAVELEQMVGSLQGFGQAASTVGGEESLKGGYPYPAALKDASGDYVHYGYWPNQEKNIGTVGVFYWEKEVGGSSGYHISYVGTVNGAVMESDLLEGASLCKNHDDGGYIESYGYGYFYSADIESYNLGVPQLAAGSGCTLGDRNTDAETELHNQMPKYTFVAYTTGADSLHLTSSQQNATWTVYYPCIRNNGRINSTSSGVYTYSVSPFFGNAMSLDSISPADDDRSTTLNSKKPGTAGNPYEIRSVDQLQYINWNYAENSATHTITGTSDSRIYNQGGADVYGGSGVIYRTNTTCVAYPYLICSRGTDKKPAELYWKQSHNVDAALEKEDTEYFAPIGSMYDTAGLDGDNSVPVMAYFAGSFDGDSYAIKNLQVNIDTQMVGVFGVTVKAEMKNIVLYADQLDANGEKRAIQNKVNGSNWYGVGGLVGFAAKGKVEKGEVSRAAFTNCTVSGYRIVDNRSSDGKTTNADGSSRSPGWGGACVGGLVGITNMDITGCTAVTDVVIRSAYNGNYTNVRVGGIAGCSRGHFESCYAGGAIINDSILSGGDPQWNTSIWTGGIVGGVIVRNAGTLKDLVGDVTSEVTVTSCYSYVEMPECQGGVAGSHSVASNGEMQNRNFNKVGVSYIKIINSYALASSVQNTQDWRAFSGKTLDSFWNSWTNANGVNVNSGDTDSNRGIYFQNDHSPYVTYDAMQKKDGTDSLISYLKSSSFGWVTTTENGASVTGKYSYPGSDRQLKGHDYPFPTVLHQTSIFSGAPNNVHYGEWPKLGLYWEEHTLTMDMLADRTTSTTALPGSSLPVVTEQETVQTETADAEQTAEQAAFPETDQTAVQTLPTEIEQAAAQALLAEEDRTAAQAASAEENQSLAVEENAAPAEQESQKISAEEDETAPEDGPALLSLDGLTAAHTYKLYVAGLDAAYVDVKNLSFVLMDEDGTEISETDARTNAPAYVDSASELQRDGEEYYFNVTFQANYPGVVLVEADLTYNGKDYTALLTLTVTADLQISLEPSSIETYVGDKTTYTVTLSDSEGNLFAPATDAELKWSMDYPAQSAQVVSWETAKDGSLAITRNSNGSYSLTLEGILSGEGSVNLNLSYKWKISDTKSLTVESTLNVRALTKPSDVLGIGDGTVFQQITVPHTIPAGTASFTGTEISKFPGTAPNLGADTVYLYATKDYTDLAKFTVISVEFKVGAGAYGAAANVSAEVSEAVTDSNGYACRVITVNDQENTQWSMRVTLERDGVSYVLVYDRPNRVEFMDGQGTALKTLRVPQGQELELNQDALAEELAPHMAGQTLETGYRWIWRIPTAAAIGGNVQVNPEQTPIHYFVSYDGNYEGWEWNEDQVDQMADSEFIYMDAGNVLRANAFTRPGYDFLGWSTSPNGDVVYEDKASFAGYTGITTHGEYLSLYAQWKQGTYSVTFHANDGTGAEAERSYTTGDTEDTLPNAEDLNFTSERTFLGWATERDATEPMTETTYSQVLAKAGYSAVDLYAVWEQQETDEDAGTDETNTEGTKETGGAEGTAGSNEFPQTNEVSDTGSNANGITQTEQAAAPEIPVTEPTPETEAEPPKETPEEDGEET